MLKERIDRIIEIKEKMMDNKEREIETEKSRLDSMIRSIADIELEIESNYDKITSTSLSGNDFSVITDYVEYLEKKKYTLIVEKESLEEKIILLKAELLDLLKEVKILGTLKEKIVASLKKSFNRREQKLLDEIALRTEEQRQ
jgi:flagellar biosynthesis chaperone FliJ